MPNMNGIGVVMRVREAFPEAKIIGRSTKPMAAMSDIRAAVSTSPERNHDPGQSSPTDSHLDHCLCAWRRWHQIT